MNQFLAQNRYRRYPLVQTATTAISDRILVDLQLILSTKFDLYGANTTGVKLSTIVRSGGNATFTFSIVSTALSGYKLVGTVSEAGPEESRVILQLQNASSVPHPELGYGILMVGVPSDLTVLGGTTVVNEWVDRATIRLNVTNDSLVLRVANRTRAGHSSCAELQGDPQSIVLQARTVQTVADCFEETTAPSEDTTQRHMTPTVTGSSTTSVPMVAPTTTHTRLQNDTTSTLTTHLAIIQDAIPDLPSNYDAEVDPAGPVDSHRVLDVGYNMDLAGQVSQKVVRFVYRLNGGLGMDCAGVMGYDDLGTLASNCIKSLNGVHSVGGRITLTAGAGISLIPDQYGHRILVLVNGQHLSRAAP